MSYNIVLTQHFKKEAKRLIKKFPSPKNELLTLSESLVDEPKQGTGLIKNCYKIRLAITSKGKGKSGGARIITHVQVTANSVFLLSIFDKSERENLTDADIEVMVKKLS